jgi:hypothetical protein
VYNLLLKSFKDCDIWLGIVAEVVTESLLEAENLKLSLLKCKVNAIALQLGSVSE